MCHVSNLNTNDTNDTGNQIVVFPRYNEMFFLTSKEEYVIVFSI